VEQLLTAREVAAAIGTRANTIYELAAAGELPSLKVPGVGRRFRESEVTAWLEDCRGRHRGARPLELVDTENGHNPQEEGEDDV
jgi:excisionase family DNA binding protein